MSVIRNLMMATSPVPDYAVFWGICTAKDVDAYWGAGAGTDCIGYLDNPDGTYTYYMFNGNHAVQWWDRFVWYCSDHVLTLHLNPKAQIWTLGNNRFNGKNPQSYDFAGVTIFTKTLRESFYNCGSLRRLDISSWDLRYCTDLYAMASQCYKLTEVNMPDVLATGSCTFAHKMFGWARELTKITGMKDCDFGAVTNFSEMFCECRKLREVEFRIDNWVTAACTDIHSMFLQCFKLDLSTLGDLTTWDVSNVTDFHACLARTASGTIDISGWDMSSADDVSQMFYMDRPVDGVNNLERIYMDGVTLNPDLTVYASMFKGCDLLRVVSCKNTSEDFVDFVKARLLEDIPDRVSSPSFSLVTDGGEYNYDAEAGEWSRK